MVRAAEDLEQSDAVLLRDHAAEQPWKWCWEKYVFGREIRLVRSMRIFNDQKEAEAARRGYELASKGLL